MSEWETWESNEPAQKCVCLACEVSHEEIAETVAHMQQAHAFSLPAVVRACGGDFYTQVRIINYVRSKAKDAQGDGALAILSHVQSWANAGAIPADVASNDDYLQPVMANDSLLSFGDDDDDDDDDDSGADADTARDTRIDFGALALSPEILSQVTGDDTASEAGPSESKADAKAEDGEKKTKETTKKKADEAEDEDEDEDNEPEADVDNYFGSYSSPHMHMEMIKDRVRTDAYRACLLDNAATLVRGKTVLDVGCGTGILSLFAAQAGAKHVYAIDMSNVVFRAMQNVIENGYEDRITVIRGKIEEVDLPVDEIDVIISEWMGYGLLYESMLDSVLFARDKWLAPTGVVQPDKSSMYLCAISHSEWRAQKSDFWDDVYGFKMTAMKEWSQKEAVVDFVPADTIISNAFTLKYLDMQTVTREDLEFECPFHLVINRRVTADPRTPLAPESLPITCDGFLLYFDIAFERNCDAAPVFFSTGPGHADTHWKQTAFFLPSPLPVHFTDVLSGTFSLKRRPFNHRALDITITYTLNGRDFHSEPKTLSYRFE